MTSPPLRAVHVVEAVRTPIGKYAGGLAAVRPDDLAAHVIEALARRRPDLAGRIDHVVFGATNQAGEDNRNVARMALLLAGLPYEVPAVTVNRLCGSGLEAVADAARMIAMGEAECVIAGGVESMTRAPFSMPKQAEKWDRTPPPVYDTTLGWRYPNPRMAARFELQSMGETAENVAKKYAITREEQDAFALESHRRAAAAWQKGAFEAELAPVTIPQKKGDPVVVSRDECVRPDASLEALAKLQPAFRKGGSVTAGNSSPINDGAAALWLVSGDVLKSSGLKPLARVVASQTAGVDPGFMGEGPIPAVKKLLSRTGLRVPHVDLFELNEAFAAQALACVRGLELDPARVNVNGGAIALGHPIGCSGARIAATLVHAMHARGAKTGVASLCIGVGQGIATLFERVMKSKTILGISAFYHDSAAALVRDGDIVAAAQEERFTRRRHDAAFPRNAIEYCLKEAGIQPEELSYVCFYDKPLKKFDRILETYFAYAPSGFASFRRALPLWLKEKLFVPREIKKGMGKRYQGPIVFCDHHESHAASAFFPSPFDRAAILTSDGVGEWATTTWGVGEGNKVRIEKVINFPHSLGLLYSAFTYFTGFKVNSGEYKLMGLAPYGQPTYADLIMKELIDIKPDGSYRLNMKYFTYPDGLRMTGKAFSELFGGEPRSPESGITKREMDLAASIQAVTEEVMLRTARHVHEVTKARYLCLAGGVALNCVANGRLYREGPFDDVWIQPAAGDAGGALGAAQFCWYQLLENERKTNGKDIQKGSLLGPRYTTEECKALCDSKGAKYRVFEEEGALLDFVSEKMKDGKVVGWMHGRMEYGPRALGARSIIGDPRNVKMQSIMNLKIKFRESFRPFAPCVLRERAHELFDISPKHENPYMLLVAPVREEFRTKLSPEEEALMKDPDLRKRVNVARSTLPAITHVDYSARVQTVDEERHGRFYRLMKAFEEKTGCPVVVNTSFNVRGEPIVMTPAHAFNCFVHTEMDLLVLEDCVLLKEEQPKEIIKTDSAKYLSQFSLD